MDYETRQLTMEITLDLLIDSYRDRLYSQPRNSFEWFLHERDVLMRDFIENNWPVAELLETNKITEMYESAVYEYFTFFPRTFPN